MCIAQIIAINIAYSETGEKGMKNQYNDYQDIEKIIKEARVARSAYLGELIGNFLAGVLKKEKKIKPSGQQQIKNRLGWFSLNI